MKIEAELPDSDFARKRELVTRSSRHFGRSLRLLADTVAKVENRTTLKSRESRYLDVSNAAMLAMPDTKVRGRFCANDVVPNVAVRGPHQRS
jgi:hypothetical protein